jgi:hypothetical protein
MGRFLFCVARELARKLSASQFDQVETFSQMLSAVVVVEVVCQ